MLARMPRPLAILFAFALVLLSAWCLTTTPPPIKTAKKGGYTDARLYHDIAAQVAQGRPYHAAAAQLHREHHYPLRPFVTMRPPTEIVMAALIGWKGIQKLCFALLVGAIFCWVVAFEGRLLWLERVAIGVAVATGGSAISSDWLMALQEYPAGLCIGVALALAVGWPGRWWYGLPVLALGLFIRETVLPYALLALVFAIVARRWREAAAWGALVGAWGGFMAWHRAQAMAQWQAGDLVSQGWNAMQGFSGFLKAVIFTSPLQPLPLGLALLLAMLPMVGWLALSGAEGLFAILITYGFGAMIAMFSRADTFYWGAIMLPWYFVGFGLLPRALVQVYGAIRGQRLGEIAPLSA
jgi:hypothetical protein